jgi:hypothetical protein
VRRRGAKREETRRERRRGWLKERGDEKREKAGVVKLERRREERDGGMRGEIGRGVRRGEEEGFRERERDRERERERKCIEENRNNEETRQEC